MDNHRVDKLRNFIKNLKNLNSTHWGETFGKIQFFVNEDKNRTNTLLSFSQLINCTQPRFHDYAEFITNPELYFKNLEDFDPIFENKKSFFPEKYIFLEEIQIQPSIPVEKVVKSEQKVVSKSKNPSKSKKISQAVKNIIIEKYTKDDKLCCYCCKFKLRLCDVEMGHIKSRKNGGADTVDNLVPLCGSCNKSISTRNVDEFLKLISGK